MSRTILALCTVFPEPNSSAAGQHLLSLLRVFAETGDKIHIASAAQQDDSAPDLGYMGYEVHSVALNCSSFNVWVRELQPDIVFYDRFMLEEQFSWRVRESVPKAMHVLDTEDLHSLRHLRQDIIKRQAFCDVSWPALKDLHQHHHVMHHPLALREIGSILRSDLSLIISPVEMEILTHCYPIAAAQLHHCPFLLPDKDDIPTPFTERKDFVFIGNYRHAPNWDAVRVLAQHIWPEIRQQLPNAQCHIYGAYTPPKAQQLHQPHKGFHIQGYAKDALATMRQAKVQLAPLRFGAGLKGKVCEAIRCHTPIVTTDIGWEGISNTVPHVSLHSEADIQQFAAVAIELYTCENTWHDFNQIAQQELDKHFNTVQHSQALVHVVNDLFNTLPAHRSQLFLQQILTQQQHASHKYMSQWIEAKQTIAQLSAPYQTPEID